MRQYPQINIDLRKLRNNCKQIYGLCNEHNIKVAAVIKGCSGIPECAQVMVEEGADFVASSRLYELENICENVENISKMLVRIPMVSEAKKVVDIADISLNSELAVLKALNIEAQNQGKSHGVILMDDLGDLREGTWEREELIELALEVENTMKNLELKGIGTNLGCYGAIAATRDKMEMLQRDAEEIEKRIGRKLEYISGGGTTSLPRLIERDMPDRVNLLRIGEGILVANDLEEIWGYKMDSLFNDVFTLDMELIEVKEKPTYPVGKIMFDGFGLKNEYVDRGMRKRGILAGGKVDYGFSEMLRLDEAGAEVIGASSDHTIIDIDQCKRNLKVGDILNFKITYANLVYLTHSPGISINIIK